MSDIYEHIKYAWLDIENVEEVKTDDILAYQKEVDQEQLGMPLARTMHNSNYLAFTAKYMLGIDLLPIQAAILNVLWTTPFPIFIASRGFGKSFSLAVLSLLINIIRPESKVILVGAGFRQAKIIFDYILKIWEHAPVLRSICSRSSDGPRKEPDKYSIYIQGSQTSAIPLGDGCLLGSTRVLLDDRFEYLGNKFGGKVWSFEGFTDVGRHIDQGVKPTRRVVCSAGYGIMGTHNHEVLYASQERIGWRPLRSLKKGGYLLVDFSNRWHNGRHEDLTPVDGRQLARILAPKDPSSFDSFTVKKWKTFQVDDMPRRLLSAQKEVVKEFIKEYLDIQGEVIGEQHRPNKFKLRFTTKHFKHVRWIQMFLSCFGIKIFTNKFFGYMYSRDLIKYMREFGSNIPERQKFFDEVADRASTSPLKIPCATIIKRLRQHIPKHVYARFRSRNYNISKDTARITVDKLQAFVDDFDFLLYSRKDFAKLKWYLEQHNKGYQFLQIRRVFAGDCPERRVYDLYVPETACFIANGVLVHNSTIRGQRAGVTMADEYNSINTEIYQTVVGGFGAVTADPIGNVKMIARQKAMDKLGMWTKEDSARFMAEDQNQSIISGTCGFYFQPLYKVFKEYHDIITGETPPKKGFSPSDFAIIRAPYEIVPRGFMSDKTVARARALSDTAIYNSEYSCCFISDTDGFFRRSNIEACTGTEENPVQLNSGNVWFDAKIVGDQGKKYVYGIDPAAEKDKFAIVILEVHGDHSRVVYSWTTNYEEFKEHFKKHGGKKTDYYGFCVRKVRDLMKLFPPEYIGLDAQGGGRAVSEGLHDPDKMEEGEHPIWEVIDDDKEKEEDDYAGLHILYKFQFAKYEFLRDANYGLRKDLEDKTILFPRYDSVALELAAHTDKLRIDAGQHDELMDTMESCIYEIEELKQELTTIVVTSTPSGRERWDTPKSKTDGVGGSGLRKDRYSALIIANYIARTIVRSHFQEKPNLQKAANNYYAIGKKSEENYASGPNWFKEGMRQFQPRMITRDPL